MHSTTVPLSHITTSISVGVHGKIPDKICPQNPFYIFTTKNTNYLLPCNSRDLHMILCLPTKDSVSSFVVQQRQSFPLYVMFVKVEVAPLYRGLCP